MNRLDKAISWTDIYPEYLPVLTDHYPHLTRLAGPCPVCDVLHVSERDSILERVVHLRQFHGWSKLKIGEWLKPIEDRIEAVVSTMPRGLTNFEEGKIVADVRVLLTELPIGATLDEQVEYAYRRGVAAGRLYATVDIEQAG